MRIPGIILFTRLNIVHITCKEKADNKLSPHDGCVNTLVLPAKTKNPPEVGRVF
jgi:hypothetical protein